MANYLRVPQPTKLQTKLYPHQLTAIYMMEARERDKKIRIKIEEKNFTFLVI